MLVTHRTGTLGSLAFLNVLLMATAFSVPAYAQIEAVVVTAQKKAEDIQTVPISVTALTGEDLAERQINTFQDLQFNVPSVTNTKTNFTSSNFEIRGVGSSGTGAAAESGVAFNVNDFYLNAAPIAETEYYDLERIEVLRGPQSTLYGRNATGGSVNVITAKPDMESFGLNAQAEYGNYNDMKVTGAVNIPIIQDKLALRAAGLWWKRDGTTTNIYDNHKVDSRDQWSVRGTLRFEPSSSTTIDLMVQASSEDSTRMRSQKSMCHFDPSGVLGCLPDTLAYQTPNLNATLGNISASPQVFAAVFSELPAALRGYYDNVVAPGLGVPAQPGLTAGQTLFAALGLGQANLSGPQASGVNPADLHKINTDFDPKYRANEMLITAQWKQRVTEWLDLTVLGGYQNADVDSRQSYYNTVGDPIIYSQQQIALIQGMAALPAAGLGLSYNTAPMSNFSLFHPTAIGGGLYTLAIPLSAFDRGASGSIGGNIQRYSDLNSGTDQSSGSDVQKAAEVRFNTNLAGPVNFLLAGYYLSYDNGRLDYFVNAPALDYAGLMIGALALPVSNLLPPGSTPGVPMAAGPAFYWNAETYTLTSQAVYGEVYYEAIPDLLKFTGGLRYTEDKKALTGRTTLYNAFVPVGTTNLDNYIATTPFSGLQGPTSYNTQITKNDALTGRFVVDYTPKLSFTEQTLFYASYSRGYKAGGSNPPLPADAPPSLNNYKPEFVNAYELGTKNLLLDGTLQANADVWYYDYKALQVAAIIDKDAINENVDAKMWGVEGEFLWAPTGGWQFNLTFATNHSDISNGSIANPRNPTNGDPNATLIKDLGSAETCVVTNDPGYPDWTAVAAGTPLPVIPPAAATPGVSHSGFSSCSNIPQVIAALPLLAPTLAGHYHFYPNGEPVSLKGNSLQNMPTGSVAFGAQYTRPFDNGYSLVTRFDGYWQSDMWGTIFNENPIDRIGSYFIANAQMQLNAPEGKWYARAFINNMFDKGYVTGMYVSDPATGLFTNEFVGQPRTFGLVVGAKF